MERTSNAEGSERQVRERKFRARLSDQWKTLAATPRRHGVIIKLKLLWIRQLYHNQIR